MFGNELRKAREEAGMTQEKLFLLSGVDRSYISDLENDKQKPSLEMVFKLCLALGIKASELIARIEESR